MDEQKHNSVITWPSHLKATRDMAYESIDLLYHESSADEFGDQLGFILSCSRHSLYQDGSQKGMLHKLEAVTLPDFARAKMAITHEVQPGLDSSSQIIHVNEELKVAGFDSGCIMPIKNFGYKKTFNSEVRSRLSHHTGQVTCLAANTDGTKLASGCTAGMITLYEVRREEIQFLARTHRTQSQFISAMAFLRHEGQRSHLDEFMLCHANDIGTVCLLDTRCDFAISPESGLMFNTNPRFGVTSLAHPRSRSEHLIFLGGPQGEVLVYDFRHTKTHQHRIEPDVSCGTIKRMKEVVIQDGNKRRTFMAFSNSTNKIQVIDVDTMKPDDRWTCDRLPEGNVRDLIQDDDRIVTCGDNVSLGCWHYKRQTSGL